MLHVIMEELSALELLVFFRLKGLCHGQKCLYLCSVSEAYLEQMGPILSSNGSLDIALSSAHT